MFFKKIIIAVLDIHFEKYIRDIKSEFKDVFKVF